MIQYIKNIIFFLYFSRLCEGGQLFDKILEKNYLNESEAS